MSISSVSSLSRARFFTRVISAMSSTGLVRKSSAPASSPLTRSAGWSSAVTMMTGICCVRGSAFSRRQTSNPSMPGIITSSRTTSARSRVQICRASGPLRAVRTSKYSAVSRASSKLHIGVDIVDDENACGHELPTVPRR